MRMPASNDFSAETQSAQAQLAQDPVRVGIVGSGVFGSYHAGKFVNSPGARLVGLHDRDHAAAARLAARLGQGSAYASYEEMLADVEAVVIATPAVTHADLARQALQAGCHCLVEKPLALKGADARALADLAAERGLVLQVGHQERLVFAAMGLLSTPERPRRIEAVRIAPRSPEGRCEDVSVVFDLMIHDLDLVAELFGADAASVTGRGRTEHTQHPDEATAELVFAGGGSAVLIASRCASERRRHMKIDYPSGRVEIDFISREIRNGTDFDIRLDLSDSLPDPLGAADAAFVAAIQGGSAAIIAGAAGARAVALAERVDASARLEAVA